MGVIYDIVTAAAICLSVAAFIRAVKIAVSVPVKTGRDIELTLIVRAKNDAGGLEHTVKSIREIGAGKISVVIIDEGMTPDAQKRAGILSCKSENVDFLTENEYINAIGAEYERKRE